MNLKDLRAAAEANAAAEAKAAAEVKAAAEAKAHTIVVQVGALEHLAPAAID